MRNGLPFWIWLQKLMYLWVKSISYPKNVKHELKIDPKKPICFVLKNNSLADLLVLENHCRLLGLPKPFARLDSLAKNKTKFSSYIHLMTLEILTSKKDRSKAA